MGRTAGSGDLLRILTLLILLILAPLLSAVASCNWVSLAANALTYRTTAAGEAGNVALYGDRAYVTRAEEGLSLVAAATGTVLKIIPPPAGMESIDDVAVADGFLFVLDARLPGHLSVFSLANPEEPAVVSAPVAVPVSPFSGVSAAGGMVAVSGGTSELTLRSYDGNGRLGTKIATADLGRGQPDLLLNSDGTRAFVSTHTWGPYFELDVLDLSSSPIPSPLAKVELKGAGFTAGGAKPANFPIEAALEGNTLAVASARGLDLFDVSAPTPQLIRTVDLGFKAVHVDVYGKTAAVVGSEPRPSVAFVDLRNPGEASVLQTAALEETAYPTGVALGLAGAVIAAHDKILVHTYKGGTP